MNKVIVIFFLLFLHIVYATISCAQENGNIEECEKWFIEQDLFNEVVSDSTVITYWENYWYVRNDEKDDKLFPDTLIVMQYIVPGMDVYLSENGENEVYHVVSKLFFKCGTYDKSYNVFNPRLSDPVILLDSIMQTMVMRSLISDSGGVIMLPIRKVPMVSILKEMNVSMQNGEEKMNSDGRRWALNQILIITSFYDSTGVERCSSEFTLPVNGCYGDPNSGKWGEY